MGVCECLLHSETCAIISVCVSVQLQTEISNKKHRQNDEAERKLDVLNKFNLYEKNVTYAKIL